MHVLLDDAIYHFPSKPGNDEKYTEDTQYVVIKTVIARIPIEGEIIFCNIDQLYLIGTDQKSQTCSSLTRQLKTDSPFLKLIISVCI